MCLLGIAILTIAACFGTDLDPVALRGSLSRSNNPLKVPLLFSREMLVPLGWMVVVIQA